MYMAAHETNNNQRLSRRAAGNGLGASDRALLRAIAAGRWLNYGLDDLWLEELWLEEHWLDKPWRKQFWLEDLRLGDLWLEGGEHREGQQHGLKGPVRNSNSCSGVSTRLLHWRPAFNSILRLVRSKAKEVALTEEAALARLRSRRLFKLDRIDVHLPEVDLPAPT
jgi:hypothetical protein